MLPVDGFGTRVHTARTRDRRSIERFVHNRLLMNLARVVAFVGLVLFSRGASATAPACFPERTVMASAPVRDDSGHVFAGVRAGHVVRVIDDFVGPNFNEALVEIAEPVRVRGYVERSRLLAFAKHPVEIEPNTRWLLTAAPLNLGEGDAVRVRVQPGSVHPDPRPNDTAPDLFGGIELACAGLQGTPPPITRRDACYGAFWSSPDRPHGKPARWREGHTPGLKVVNLDPLPRAQDEDLGGREPFMLARKGDRVLVEAWDWTRDRVRRWVKADRLRPGRGFAGDRAFITECKCCPAVLAQPGVGEANIELRTEAQLRLSPGATPVLTLAAKTRVRLDARLGRQAFVTLSHTAGSPAFATALVHGWVDWAALESPHGLSAGYPGHADPIAGVLGAIRVGLHRLGNELFVFPIEGLIDPSGDFLLPHVLETGYGLSSFVETREGVPMCERVMGAELDRARTFVCKQLAQAWHVVRVVTADGLGIPNALVGGPLGPLNDWGEHQFFSTHTGPDGRARLPRIPNPSFVGAVANGFLSTRIERVDDVVVRLELKRQSVLAGSLPRTREGVCVGAESPFKMTPECLYSGSRLSPDPDSFKMCSEAGCDGQPRAWLFVRVTNDDNNLVAGARVRASVAGRLVGTCLAPSGACFLHALPAGQEIQVDVTTPQGNGSITITAEQERVTELTVPL